VTGFWVFGGVERTPEKKFFAVKVPDRSAATLMELIRSYIRPGSIILSDCWSAYNGISNCYEERYQHKKVNHSEEFVASDGTHTNTIEGTWWALKRHTPKKIDNIDQDELLLEQIWRRRHHTCLWERFLCALSSIHYGNKLDEVIETTEEMNECVASEYRLFE
jgi:transposase-like protein